MVSDAVLLALIQNFVPTITAIGAIILGLRVNSKLKERDAHKRGADVARARRQRATDVEAEQLAGTQRVPSAADLAQPGYPLALHAERDRRAPP